jgi:hypothetical protein
MMGVLPAPLVPWRGAMTDYGPKRTDVGRIIERAAHLSVEDAQAIVDARLAWDPRRGTDDAERAALRAAFRAAKRAHRLEAYLAARHDAADAFRLARRGEVGPWLAVAAAVSNAAGATVVEDLLALVDYEVLYRPWRIGVAGAELTPVGPGHSPFGAAQRRGSGVHSR